VTVLPIRASYSALPTSMGILTLFLQSASPSYIAADTTFDCGYDFVFSYLVTCNANEKFLGLIKLPNSFYWRAKFRDDESTFWSVKVVFFNIALGPVVSDSILISSRTPSQYKNNICLIELIAGIRVGHIVVSDRLRMHRVSCLLPTYRLTLLYPERKICCS